MRVIRPRLLLLHVSICCLLTPGVSLGQEESPASAGPDPESAEIVQLEEVVVVGSRFGGRSITDSPVPVDLVTREELLDTGHSELGRIIQTVIPSFNFSSSTISDGTDSVRPATLRGMGPDQVLVLVNGKRRHGSALIHVNTSVGRGTAGTDINAIPASAIERIEVLRDGAAAQYGSDAIAGVINIVLKDDLDGDLRTSYGLTDLGDGQRYNLTLNKGFKIGTDGVLYAAVEYTHRGRTNRAGLDGTIQYSDTDTCSLDECTLAQLYPDDQNNDDNQNKKNALIKTYPQNPTVILNDPGGKERNFNRRNFRVGDAKLEQVTGALNFKKPLDSIWSGAEFYAFADFSRAQNLSGGFYRRSHETDRNPLGSIYPNGFLPLIRTTVWDFSGGGGITKNFDNNLKVDFSVVHGGNTFNFDIRNSHNASWVACSITKSCADFPDMDVSATPTSADAGTLKLFLTTVNLDFSLPVRNNIHVAWGAAYRRDLYQIEAGELYSYEDYDGAGGGVGGIQVFPGFKPDNEVDETRHAVAAYADTAIYFSDRFMVSPAVRYENYSDFGNTINGKVATKLDVFDWFALRGSVSTGFRAPSMQQLYFNNVSTQFNVDPDNPNEQIPIEVGTFRNDSDIAKAIGIPQLDAETAINLSAGFVFQPFSSLTITTDFYHIQIDDRIIVSGRLDPTAKDSDGNFILPGNIRSALTDEGIGQAQFFLNGADTRTQGLDIVALWDVPFVPKGNLSLKLLGSIMRTKITSVNLPAGLSSDLFTDQDRSILEEWQPRDRFTLSGVYTLDKFSASVAIHRFGKYTVTDGKKQTFSPKYLTDVELNYDLGPFGIIKAGANNLFNVTPDRNTIGQSRAGTIIDSEGNLIVDSTGVFQYSRRSAPFGFNGAFYYFAFEYPF